MTDFCRLPARHDAINLRCEHWAMWVRVRPQAWKTAPMFQQYRAPRQYAAPAVLALNSLECHEIERAVSLMPEKHRAALRWFYVYRQNPRGMAQRLAVTTDALLVLVVDGLDMLKNRLRTTINDGTMRAS